MIVSFKLTSEHDHKNFDVVVSLFIVVHYS